MEKIKIKYLVNECTYSNNILLHSESFSSGNLPPTFIGSLDLF